VTLNLTDASFSSTSECYVDVEAMRGRIAKAATKRDHEKMIIQARNISRYVDHHLTSFKISFNEFRDSTPTNQDPTIMKIRNSFLDEKFDKSFITRATRVFRSIEETYPSNDLRLRFRPLGPWPEDRMKSAEVYLKTKQDYCCYCFPIKQTSRCVSKITIKTD
jgi:hypothetical protein